MATVAPESLQTLYERDETAWLELTASLIAEGRFSEVNREQLSEYLTDMAKRDRREVSSRLTVLMTHLLKWEHQSNLRSGSWKGTIREQRRELRQLLDSGTLRNYAQAILEDTYAEARKQAADETTLAEDQFPLALSWSLDDLLTEESL